MNVIINGLGVAGPALAFWLTKAGHKVLLVEQAPVLRRGGYVIDFWGIGYDIVEKMGLTAEIRRLGYQVREVRYVGDVRKKQASATKLASSIAPTTSFGISFRNTVTKLMRVPFVAEYVVGRSLRDEIELPQYDFTPRSGSGRDDRQ